MSEADLKDEEQAGEEESARAEAAESESLDEDNRLKPEFVRSVKEALDQ
jgi:magnesium transporter